MLYMPEYNTETFCDIFTNVDEFISFYHNNGIKTTISDENANLLYYLLYAQYGNSPIANYDVYQFKMKLSAIIFKYGPAWESKLKIQEVLRGLSEEELIIGSREIRNHAYNPSEGPSTSALQELGTINEQTSHGIKRGKLDAYATLAEILKDDVSDAFLNKFKVLFKQFVMPENPILYTEGD